MIIFLIDDFDIKGKGKGNDEYKKHWHYIYMIDSSYTQGDKWEAFDTAKEEEIFEGESNI